MWRFGDIQTSLSYSGDRPARINGIQRHGLSFLQIHSASRDFLIAYREVWLWVWLLSLKRNFTRTSQTTLLTAGSFTLLKAENSTSPPCSCTHYLAEKTDAITSFMVAMDSWWSKFYCLLEQYEWLENCLCDSIPMSISLMLSFDWLKITIKQSHKSSLAS